MKIKAEQVQLNTEVQHPDLGWYGKVSYVVKHGNTVSIGLDTCLFNQIVAFKVTKETLLEVK